MSNRKYGSIMKEYLNPEKKQWSVLCERAKIPENRLEDVVSEILKNVNSEGDKALFKYSQLFDDVLLNELRVTKDEVGKAIESVDENLKNAIKIAKNNIENFHSSQIESEKIIETTKGVRCWRKSVGIEKVGLYIPGGNAPLFSTILMLGVPAKIAGCKDIVICTPPNQSGEINPAILYTANLVGITEIFKVGGAQAIGAMAFGTETIPQVYKIFGPGNQYVTKAKEIVQNTGTAIDMPAGPSEVLVVADDSCNVSFVASDLLSQAEHGVDSQVILLSSSKSILDEVLIELNRQLEFLPRKSIAKKALVNSKAILFKTIDDCFDFSNKYAPEHLIIASDDAEKYQDKIINAGSVFLGNYSCESAGDYASGTNHTLPTYGYARTYSGVSLDSFVKKITFQKLSKEGIKNIGEIIELMAEAEGLIGHKNAVSLRLKSLENV